MANTVTRGRSTIHIKFDGSTAYDHGEDICIVGIQLYATTSDHIITIRDLTTSGVPVAKFKFSDDVEQKEVDWSSHPQGGKWCRPCVASADVSANVEAIFHIKG